MNDLLSPIPISTQDGLCQAYGALPHGVMTVGGLGMIDYANPAALALLAPLQPVGLTLGAAFGLSGITGGEPMLAALREGTASEPTRVTTADGRVLDGRVLALAEAHMLVTLYDVTAYVRSALGAARDSLTGVLTRAGLDEHLTRMLAESRRTGVPVAVIYIDLDKFKTVNDTLGHPVGDALLLKVADRLRSAVRSDDIIARLGGDEFALLQMAEPQPDAVEALARRVVELLGRTYIAAGHMITIGASAGIALSPTDGQDATTLLKHADLALYRAKADGRGVFRYFKPAMDTEIQERRLLEVDLRRALALKQFELFYQPQVNLRGDILFGFEALLRWRSPSRGLVPPAMFIPVVEEIGLIGRIGEWVLQTACRQAALWPAPISVAVNVSPLQFRSGKLVGAVKAALTAADLAPDRLELEITETTLLDNTEAVLATLHELKALGVRISMDDFGTGYSSLSYLQKFPFDKIKIDQSFVRTSARSEEANAIVRAVAALGETLGMTTIAEGVETTEQLERMRAEGCAAVQGYLTGRPVPAAEATALLGGIRALPPVREVIA